MKKQSIILIMLTTILNLFGCSMQTGKSNKKHIDITEEQITKSIEDYNNRPIHKNLTLQIIDTTSDNNLLYIVCDNLIEKLPTDYNKEYETVINWNKSRQAIYLIWLLEAEVNNGGFNQFYGNASGQFYKLLPDALKLVAANKFAVLTQKTNEVFEKEHEQITKHQDGTIEGFSKSYDDNPLDPFDNEFYTLYKTENLQQLQVNYIREHKEEFVD